MTPAMMITIELPGRAGANTLSAMSGGEPRWH